MASSVSWPRSRDAGSRRRPETILIQLPGPRQDAPSAFPFELASQVTRPSAPCSISASSLPGLLNYQWLPRYLGSLLS